MLINCFHTYHCANKLLTRISLCQLIAPTNITLLIMDIYVPINFSKGYHWIQVATPPSQLQSLPPREHTYLLLFLPSYPTPPMVGVVLERECHAAADQQQQQCWGTRVRDSQPRLTPHQQQQQQWHRQQQQQGQPSVGPATSPSANRAYELYRECVWAGQWARFTVDQSNSSNSCCCSSQKNRT